MLEWCTGYLEKHGDPDPRGSAQWLVGHATGLKRIELYLDMDRVLNAGELDFMRDAVRRRAKGEPLQYLTGSAPFRFITVQVAPGVLIPRPETEVLVSTLLEMLPKAPHRIATDSYSEQELEQILASRHTVADQGQQEGQELQQAESESEQEFGPAFIEAPKVDSGAQSDTMAEEAYGDQPEVGSSAVTAQDGLSEAGASGAHAVAAGAHLPNEGAQGLQRQKAAPLLHVLEIGTGSGCIACSLANERSDVRVTATDISAVAADLARRNAQRLGVSDRVQVICCDLGAGLDSAELGTFDALISNPPYIPTAVYEGLQPEVHDYEPQVALDGGPDGLDFFRRLLPFGLQALKAGAPFTIELHEDSLEQAKQLAEDAGYQDVRIVSDMAGRPRILAARTPQNA